MISLDQVKLYLRKTNDTNDDSLDELRRRAIAHVERNLDWYFGPARATQEVLSGQGRPSIWLRQPPLNTVVVSLRSGIGDLWESVETEDFEVDGRGVHNSGGWPCGYRNLRFQYDEGFVEPPGDIVELVLELIQNKWLRFGKSDMKSETLGRYSYTRGDLEDSKRWSTVKSNWKRGRI